MENGGLSTGTGELGPPSETVELMLWPLQVTQCEKLMFDPPFENAALKAHTSARSPEIARSRFYGPTDLV